MKILMSAIFLGLSFGAFAQEKGTLDVLTVVQKEEVVVSKDGKTESRLVAIKAVVPGERVFYTITFTNVGSNPAEDVVITNPIASELTYVGECDRVEDTLAGYHCLCTSECRSDS